MTELRVSWSLDYAAKEIHLRIMEADNPDSMSIIIPFDNISELEIFNRHIQNVTNDVSRFVIREGIPDFY